MTISLKYNSKIEVALPGDDALRAVFGEKSDPSTVLNNIRMFAGTEDLASPAIALIRAIFGAQGVSERTREMIILRAAKVRNAPYVWQVNVELATNTGLSSAEIEAAASDGAVTGVDAEYLLVCTATDELCKTGTVTDETLKRLIGHFGEVVARKVILIVAFFDMVSLFLNGCRVPLERVEKIGKRTTPLGVG